MSPGVAAKAAFAKGLDVAEGVQRREDALSAVSQTIKRMQTPMLSATAQGAIRTALSPEIEAEEEASSGRERDRLLEAINSLESRRAAQDPTPQAAPPPVTQAMPEPTEEGSIFEPLPDTPLAPALSQFDPALSPTIVPLDKDRELAMRTRGNLGGIASLA